MDSTANQPSVPVIRLISKKKASPRTFAEPSSSPSSSRYSRPVTSRKSPTESEISRGKAKGSSKSSMRGQRPATGATSEKWMKKPAKDSKPRWDRPLKESVKKVGQYKPRDRNQTSLELGQGSKPSSLIKSYSKPSIDSSFLKSVEDCARLSTKKPKPTQPTLKSAKAFLSGRPKDQAKNTAQDRPKKEFEHHPSDTSGASGNAAEDCQSRQKQPKQGLQSSNSKTKLMQRSIPDHSDASIPPFNPQKLDDYNEIKVQEVDDCKPGMSVPSTHRGTIAQSKISGVSPKGEMKYFSKTTLEPYAVEPQTAGSFLNQDALRQQSVLQQARPNALLNMLQEKLNENQATTNLVTQIMEEGSPSKGKNSTSNNSSILRQSIIQQSALAKRGKERKPSFIKSLIEDSENFSSIDEVNKSHFGLQPLPTTYSPSPCLGIKMVLDPLMIHQHQHASRASVRNSNLMGDGSSGCSGKDRSSYLFSNTLEQSRVFDENSPDFKSVDNMKLSRVAHNAREVNQNYGSPGQVRTLFNQILEMREESASSKASPKKQEKASFDTREFSEQSVDRQNNTSQQIKLAVEEEYQLNYTASEQQPQKQEITDLVTQVSQSEEEKSADHSDIHYTHLMHTLQSLQYIRSLLPPPRSFREEKGLDLPPTTKKKTVIFDLDETLVHCIEDIDTTPYDLPITVTFQTGEQVNAGVNVRPFAYECLKSVRQHFQVVIFTASHQSYADAVLDTLEEEFRKETYLTEDELDYFGKFDEPLKSKKIREMKSSQKLFDYRLYRDSCFRTSEGVFIKDLSLIRNRELTDMIIIDNAVYSFGFHLNNGIPIIPYYSKQSNPSDEELLHLICYCSSLVEIDDVRTQNEASFQLKSLMGLSAEQQRALMTTQSKMISSVAESENESDDSA